MTATPLDRLQQLKRETGLSFLQLTALTEKADPYRCGTDRDIELAEWFADLWQREGWTPPVHLRRIHYRLMSYLGTDQEVLRPDGQPYINDEESWRLLEEAGRVARHLGYVAADNFEDRRNTNRDIREGGFYRHVEPSLDVGLPFRLYGVDDLTPLVEVTADVSIELDRMSVVPTAPRPPTVRGYEYQTGQESPYRLEIWIEKSTMSDVLEPISRRYGASLITGIGFQSITAAIDLLKRSDAPVRVFYIADFDAAGENMAPAVARQIEFYREQFNPDLDVAVDFTVLTEEQVQRYSLPRSPHKEDDPRAASWDERRGEGRVELDALEALYPGELERILTDRIKEHLDHSIWERMQDAGREAERHVSERWHATVDEDLLDQRRSIAVETEEILDRRRIMISDLEDELRGEVDQLVEEYRRQAEEQCAESAEELAEHFDRIADIDRQIAKLTAGIEYDELPERPAPEISVDRDGYLFDASRDYLTQLLVYKRHRKVDDLERRECARPDCSKTFLGMKRRIYCSRACTRTMANRAFRERQKASEA